MFDSNCQFFADVAGDHSLDAFLIFLLSVFYKHFCIGTETLNDCP